MSAPSKRRVAMSLRTAGHAFWVGLGISLALHAFFLFEGRFPQTFLNSPPPLQARLEAFEAVTSQPQPQPPVETASPVEPQPKPEPRPASAPAPEPAAEYVVPSEPSAPEVAPQPAAEPMLPLSKAAPPPPSSQPYALLTQAAESIRNLPEHLEIVYELKGVLSGHQIHTWQRSGQRYSLVAVAEATGLTSIFMNGKLVQKSSGRIGALGLMPERYEIQRPTGRSETLEFDYAGNVIESSRMDPRRETRTRQLPLLPGAQDPLSSIYQLAMAARDGKDGLIVAAGSKKVQGYPYRMLGTETLRTPLGEIKTLHVARMGESGKGDTQLWLAQNHYALPVKISYVDEDGMEWVLEASSISEH